MSAHSVRVAGFRVDLFPDTLQPRTALPAPADAGDQVVQGCPWVIIERAVPAGQQRPASPGRVRRRADHRCGAPREDGQGNPLGYCTEHLNAIAGEQEDWENEEEYQRRRLQDLPVSSVVTPMRYPPETWARVEPRAPCLWSRRSARVVRAPTAP